MPDWHKIKFLESGANLKPLLKLVTGRTPSTRIVRDVGACLQQGRFYYDAAAAAPLEIRPLLLFYGYLAFARALVAGRTLRPLSGLAHTHGLGDSSGHGGRIRDLKVTIGATGSFQEFNDVVCGLGRVCYINANLEHANVPTPMAASTDLSGKQWSLKNLLSRVPGIEEIFRLTFGENSNTDSISLSLETRRKDLWEIRIDDPERFVGRDELKALVGKWRQRHTFLGQWRFVEGGSAWGNSILLFVSTSNVGIDEFSEAELKEHGDGTFQATHDPRRKVAASPAMPVASILAPMAGGFPGERCYATTPIDGVYPSEYALHYLVLFLLSSLVRYRPDAWAHSISRSALPDRASDDQEIALIEQFFEIHVSTVVGLVVAALNPHEDRYA